MLQLRDIERGRALNKAKAPSARQKKIAFNQAKAYMNESTFRDLTAASKRLLISKGGNVLAKNLFDALVSVSENYPLDVITSASLAFAGNSYAGYLGYLGLQRINEGDR